MRVSAGHLVATLCGVRKGGTNPQLRRFGRQRFGSPLAPEAHVEATVVDRCVPQPRPVARGTSLAIHSGGTIRNDIERLDIALDAVEATDCLRVAGEPIGSLLSL
ncbi:MAG: hypothetical protein LC799_18200, partial [Actinobacteria bacterium]|nr:hypothetical protein [Actinomycetota bacterium]